MANAVEVNNTILVVEEDQRIAFLLDFLLSREGYQVINVTPTQRYQAISGNTHPPKLIIMGSRVSFADNNELISRVRNHQQWKTVPIIVLIDTYVKEKMLGALDAGANDFLMQPFDSNELMAQISRHTVSVH